MSSAHAPVLHLGGTRVSEVIRFDIPATVQQYSGVKFQAKYHPAGHLHVGIDGPPPPVPLVIYLSGLDNHSSAIDDRFAQHCAKQGNAQGAFLMLFPLRPSTHWWLIDKYGDR
eukprot:6485635-Amphidinium_carterae.1